MNLEARIADLKARHTAAQREQLRAEHARDSAAATAEAARKVLADEFGVNDRAGAQAKLDELRADLTTTLNQLTAALDAIGV